jgi:hypothetical protein
VWGRFLQRLLLFELISPHRQHPIGRTTATRHQPYRGGRVSAARGGARPAPGAPKPARNAGAGATQRALRAGERLAGGKRFFQRDSSLSSREKKRTMHAFLPPFSHSVAHAPAQTNARGGVLKAVPYADMRPFTSFRVAEVVSCNCGAVRQMRAMGRGPS